MTSRKYWVSAVSLTVGGRDGEREEGREKERKSELEKQAIICISTEFFLFFVFYIVRN